jgi:hypothetical protein
MASQKPTYVRRRLGIRLGAPWTVADCNSIQEMRSTRGRGQGAMGSLEQATHGLPRDTVQPSGYPQHKNRHYARMGDEVSGWNAGLRSRVEAALEALCDREFQARLWVRGERLNHEELGFDDTILVIIDELESSQPDEFVGYFLHATELQPFIDLQNALIRLVDRLGIHGSYSDALSLGPQWRESVEAAQNLRRAMAA